MNRLLPFLLLGFTCLAPMAYGQSYQLDELKRSMRNDAKALLDALPWSDEHEGFVLKRKGEAEGRNKAVMLEDAEAWLRSYFEANANRPQDVQVEGDRITANRAVELPVKIERSLGIDVGAELDFLFRIQIDLKEGRYRIIIDELEFDYTDVCPIQDYGCFWGDKVNFVNRGNSKAYLQALEQVQPTLDDVLEEAEAALRGEEAYSDDW